MLTLRRRSVTWVLVLALFVLLPAASIAHTEARPALSEPVAGVDYVDGRVLVKFAPGASAIAQVRAHRAAGGQVAGVVRGVDVKIVEVGAGRTLAALNAYSRNPNVVYAEVDGIVQATLDCTEDVGTISNDDCSWRQWGLHNDGSSYGNGSGTADADVDIPEAWDTGNTGAGIIIAVLDTGYDTSHDDLLGKVDASAFFAGSAIDDGHGHGTWTATIAAANTDNFAGIAGAAPDARLIIGKVLDDNGSGSWSSVANGINWAVQEAGDDPLVISMSLGGGCRGGPFGCSTLENAVNNAWNSGAVLIAAAGNSGGSTEYPGAFANVLAIAATDANDAIASFSSVGNVAAPGVSIIGAFPDCSDGETFTMQSSGFDCHYDYGSGTSASTPIVAGIAAIVWSSNTGMANTAVRSHIEASAEDVPGTSRDGLGRVSACTALVSAGVPCTEGGDGGGGDPDNDPPVAEDFPVTTNEDTAVDITLSGSDAESCELTFSIVSGPSNGTLSGITNSACAGAPNTDTAQVTYTPDPDYNGPDLFTYRVTDGDGGTDDASVSITVSSVNDAPVAVDDSYSTTVGTQLVVDEPGVLANDTDVDGDNLTAILVSGPTSGGFTFDADGSFTYTPETGFTGDVTFTYKANDGELDSNEATVTIAVSEQATTMHIESLTGSNQNNGSTWTAIVTILVHDSADEPVADVVVEFSWSGGASGIGGCNTSSNGTCSVSVSGIHKRSSSVTFTVDGLTHATLGWDGSGPTSSTINKP